MRECLERWRGEDIGIRYVEVWAVLHTSARDKGETESRSEQGGGRGQPSAMSRERAGETRHVCGVGVVVACRVRLH